MKVYILKTKASVEARLCAAMIRIYHEDNEEEYTILHNHKNDRRKHLDYCMGNDLISIDAYVLGDDIDSIVAFSNSYTALIVRGDKKSLPIDYTMVHNNTVSGFQLLMDYLYGEMPSEYNEIANAMREYTFTSGDEHRALTEGIGLIDYEDTDGYRNIINNIEILKIQGNAVIRVEDKRISMVTTKKYIDKYLRISIGGVDDIIVVNRIDNGKELTNRLLGHCNGVLLWTIADGNVVVILNANEKYDYNMRKVINAHRDHGRVMGNMIVLPIDKIDVLGIYKNKKYEECITGGLVIN